MAKTYRVAVIAGDGIGREVVPEGIAAMEAAARRYGFGFEWKEFDWSCETYAKTGRMMPEDGIDQLTPVRLGLSRRGRLSRRARSHLAVGAADPVAARVPAIRQLAPGAAPRRGRHAAEEPRARRHRFLCRAREQRGRIFLGRRPALRGHRIRDGDAAGGVHPPRLRPGHALRLRAGEGRARSTSPRRPSRTASSTPCRIGTSASPRSPRTIPTSRPTSTTSTS